MSSTTAPVFKLNPGIQSYAWGKKGSGSLAAQLAETCIPDFKADEEKTYAELWMGTHPTLPSRLTDGETLADHIKADSSLLGDAVIKRFPDSKNGDLPFLFKVLSIGTALSIQAHPDKELGERLHKERPDIYKDSNHKPEMAIALTPFLAFLNFLPLQTILLNLLTVTEFESLIPQELVEELATSLLLPSTKPPVDLLFTPTISPPTESQKKILQKIFGALMSASPEAVKEAIDHVVLRYTEKEMIADCEKPLVDLTIMLNEQYPGDVGVLCVFMLNVVELKRGEAAFLGANMPHAYISGDIIECMATSDNVVRAGLTPKLRDVDTLVSMLTYEAGPGSKQLLKPVSWDGDEDTLLYDPPIDEFSVLKVELAEGKEDKHRAVEGPSICIVTEGKGEATWGDDKVEFGRGDVIFVGAGHEVTWSASEKVKLFRAFVEAK